MQRKDVPISFQQLDEGSPSADFDVIGMRTDEDRLTGWFAGTDQA